MHLRTILALILMMAAATAMAAVTPNSLFSDGSVLQQGMPVPVWGAADDGENVVVEFQGQKLSTTAQNGRWMVRLRPLKLGGPFTMKINDLEIKDILVGEVWVCSGQSNTAWPLSNTNDSAQTLASCADPMMRFFKVPYTSTKAVQTDINSVWTQCNAETAAGFSAVGYYFGRELRKSLRTPIGVINSSVGGTYVAQWTSFRALAGIPWKNDPKASGLYNGMIRPLQPFAIRGVIWYQGESDTGRSALYRRMFPNMIRNWREDWGQGDFPFLFVQLAPYTRILTEPAQSSWAELREAQTMTCATVPNTAMAVITDCGDETDIHPRTKEPVGVRLALAARATVYGQDVTHLSPMFDSMIISKGRATVKFKNAEGGLVVRGDNITGFAIAGADRVFYNAQATAAGNKVTVWSPQVPEPVAVRYGWADFPVINLFNKAGLPACPFRTDDFPMKTAARQ